MYEGAEAEGSRTWGWEILGGPIGPMSDYEVDMWFWSADVDVEIGVVMMGCIAVTTWSAISVE